MYARIHQTALALFAALFFTALAGPAIAQMNGGFEGREYEVVVDPGGANILIGTVWFGYGESIWIAEDKIDAADMSGDIVFYDKGTSTVPSHLSTSYSSTTLSSSESWTDVHTYERPSDNEIDMMVAFELEASCSTDCYVVGVEFLMVDDLETDLENPTLSGYAFDYTTSFTGLSGDVVETHDVQ